MTGAYIFPNIDKSYWPLDNKEWVAERNKNWERIEKYYYGGREKSKKGMNILKRYYLKGEIPDFEPLMGWDDESSRHLDLYAFLWMHPSKDEELLIQLRDQYVNSPLVSEYDIKIGCRFAMDVGCMLPTYDTRNLNQDTLFDSGGLNLLMFTVIFGDLSIDYFPEKRECRRKVEKFYNGYQYIFDYGNWLCVKNQNPLSEDCLYQYDEFLEYWEKTCSLDGRYFEGIFATKVKPQFIKALHRINRFDVAGEGDTARGRFVHKIRKLLDEHEFHPTLKELWAEVKSDANDVKGLWRV